MEYSKNGLKTWKEIDQTTEAGENETELLHEFNE